MVLRYMLFLLQLDVEAILYIVEGSSSHVPIPHNITIFLLGSVHDLQLRITPTCCHNDNYNKIVHFNKYAYGHVCQHFSIYEQSICCLLHFFWYHEVRGKLKLMHSSYCLYAHPNNITNILCSTPSNKLHSRWPFGLELCSL